jgi:hypothetical protein
MTSPNRRRRPDHEQKIGSRAPAPLLGANPGYMLQRNEIASGPTLEDLDPSSAPVPTKKQAAIARADKDKRHHNVKITNKNYVGGYEQAGAETEVPRIFLSQAARAAGGETIMELETDYNAYTPLLRVTLKAMGRLKDLEAAGAKTDPAQLMADPRLAARFRPFDANRSGDDERPLFDMWSASATDERIAVRSMGAGFKQLKAAISGFRAAGILLKMRRKRAALEGAQSKKEAIDQKVEMLEKIIDTSFKAVEWADSIETFIESTRELHDLETIEAKESYKQTRSVQQSLGGGASWMAMQVKKRHEKVESWLKSGGLTLKNVLIFATGDAKEYEALTRQISQLQNDLSDLGFEEESLKIKEADEQLQGMKIEVGTRVESATAKREQARAMARNFGHKTGGDEGALAMFAAQAYQDLAIYGRAADQIRRTRIDPYLGWLYGFLKDNAYVALGHGWQEDWYVLRTWGQQMVEQRDFFSAHQPVWNAKADAWNEFFAQMSGGALVRPP